VNDLFASLIRTWVPILVGAGVSWLFVHGVVVDTNVQAAAVVMLTAAIQGGYYLTVRLLEKKWPNFGVLLGRRTPPEYEKA
jgi:hypothetical protein